MNAIRIRVCAGCGALCENAEYCCCCREDAELHARRADGLYGGLARESGVMPAEVRKQIAGRLLRRGIDVVLLAMWLWMAADILGRHAH